MLNMLKLKASPNHSKSLTLGSRDSFYLISTFLKKINSNHLTLQPRNPKILGNVPRFRLSKNFFILILHTHRQSLDWPLISILTSQPIHEACSSPWKTSNMFSIYEKTVNHKTSWKVSFGSYRGPLQIPIDIGPMSSTLHAVNGRFVFWSQPVTRTAITQTLVDINFSLFFLSWVTLIDTFMPIYGSKFWISIALEFH